VREQDRPITSGRSHPGIVRLSNEDRFARFDSPFGQVFVIADGMGGAKGGATAAQLVVDGFQKSLLSSPAGTTPIEALRAAADSVAATVHSMGSGADPAVAGMGSTVVLALVSGANLIVAHVGDSRAYLYRDTHLQQLTRDHTVVQRMVDAGMLSEEAARNHPDASVLSRAIGPEAHVDIEISPPVDLKPGDGVLLCSDGLSGYVDDPSIEERLKHYETAPEEAVSSLIQTALQAGGQDNVTVQYILVPRLPSAVRERPGSVAGETSIPRRFLRNIVLILAAIVLIGLVLYGVTWQSRGGAASGDAQPRQNGGQTVGGAPDPK
jgi:serine/threonine protein phosphatase PrpC